jgi:succinate-semialdehyde dehydrogenase / glutarate-semialdehyde dehydrogenase
MAFESIDPSTGARLAVYPAHAADEVELRLATAAAAAASWRRVPVAQRAAAVGRLGELLARDLERLAVLLTSEMGKPILQSRAEVTKCVTGCAHYAAHAEEMLAPRQVATEATRSYVRFDPIGAVLAIMPWNFPFWQVIRMLAPVVAGGNVLLLKSAPTTMGTGEAIAELALEAGLPPGVVQTLRIEPDVIRDVIGDDRVQGVSFTGSTRGGRAVASIAGAHGKRTVLELGGSDPFVVLDDADIARVAQTAVASRLINGGQSCVSAKRFVVMRAVADEFTQAMEAGIRAAVVGDPREEGTTVGPMARDDLRDQLAEQVRRSVAGGATLVVTGGPREGPGFFYVPSMLTGVDRGHAVGDEETFGPVAAVLVADDEESALRMANDTDYGLGGAVWTADLDRGERFIERLDAGTISINDMVKSDPRLPFGGVKASGYGRELAVEGIREFMNVKSVWANA